MSIFQKSVFPTGRAAALVIALCVLFYASFSGFAVAQDKATSDFDEAFELVLGVKRGDKTITNSLLGFQRGFTGYYLPVKGLAELLELYVDVNIDEGTASGWFLRPEDTFSIDVPGGTYTVRGELVDLAPDDAFVRQLAPGFGDLYVRMDVLETIWPLDMEMDFKRLQLNINYPRKLPFELRQERLERRDYLLGRNADGIDLTGFKVVDNPYRMFSPPAIDVNTSLNWDQGEKEFENQTNINGKNDLLGFSADYNLNFEYRDKEFISPEDLRLTLTRRAWDHQDPMALGIRELRLGDISTFPKQLISGADSGRGVGVSSRPLRRVGAFDEVTVEGTATPGWEIELYRGSELIDFATVSETGEYRFDNIQLFGGSNVIHVMLYGPAGQVEERVEEYEVGGLLPPGDVEYEAAVVDVTDNLISFRDEEGRRSFNRREEEGVAYSALAKVGVNRWMSLFASGVNAIGTQGEEEEEKYVTAGADLSLGPVRANIEAYKKIGGGNALDTRFLTNMLGWRVNLRGQFGSDFESERVGYGDSARTLDLQASVSNRYATDLGRLSVTATANHERLRDESKTTRYELSTDLAQRGYSYGNQLNANYFNGHLDRIDGQANASFRIGRDTTARGLLGYAIKPEFDFRTISTDIDYRHSSRLSAGLDLRRNLITQANSAGANINYDFGLFLGSLATNWQQDGGVDVTLRASSSIAPYGENGNYIMRSRSLRQNSALNSFVFHDANLNNIFDGEDTPVENAILLYGQRESEPTNEYGFTSEILAGQGEYQPVLFKEQSTDNPFHASAYPGYAVQMRPGTRQAIAFPLVTTGMIDGTAYFSNGSPVPGLRMQLVDASGAPVQETLTAFDGYYTFEFVRPGNYIIRSNPALDIHAPVQMVTVAPDALFVYGLNVTLLENAGLPPSTIEVDPAKAQENLSPILSSLSRLQNTLRDAVSGS